MSLTITQSELSDLPAVAKLLREAFQVSENSAIVDEKLLRWKYYESHPEWNGSRSFVVKDGDRIVAHAGVWPQHLRTPEAEIRGLGFYDWVSDVDYRGAGLQLVKQLLAMSEAMVVIGGAEITRKILPRFGFTQAGEVSIYARVLRPWKQYRTRTDRMGWREAGRVLRNFSWSMRASCNHAGWCAEPLEGNPDEQFSHLERQSATAGTLHSASFFRYFRRCPSAPVKLFRLLQGVECQGYLAMSLVDGQMRILDLRVVGGQEDWNAACSLSIEKAKETKEAAELMGLASTPRLRAAFEANHFQHRGNRPLFLYDPSETVSPHLPLHIGMLDDDSGFLRIPGNPYLT